MKKYYLDQSYLLTILLLMDWTALTGPSWFICFSLLLCWSRNLLLYVSGYVLL